MTPKFNLQLGPHLSTSNCHSASPHAFLIDISSIKYSIWPPKLILLPKSSTTVFLNEEQLRSFICSGQKHLRHSWHFCLTHIHAFFLSYPTPNPTNSIFKIYPESKQFLYLHHYYSGPSHHYILCRLLQWPLKSPCFFLRILNIIATGILQKLMSDHSSTQKSLLSPLSPRLRDNVFTVAFQALWDPMLRLPVDPYRLIPYVPAGCLAPPQTCQVCFTSEYEHFLP